MNEINGVVTRVGDETIGEVWSLYDGQEMLNSVDPRFGKNIEHHVKKALHADPFHVSANTDPKGDRSKRPQDQDPDMLLHVVKETDRGIVVRGAKFETAAARPTLTKPLSSRPLPTGVILNSLTMPSVLSPTWARLG